jgi:Rps23 Pro-64 3,4-dihydroxylase Tpa1-like proline 4-hydroxylase
MEEVKGVVVDAQQEGDKVSKKFDGNIKKLVALFNGDKAFKKAKVANSDIKTIIEELTKEKKEALVKEFKEKASKLLTSKVEFDKFVSQKEKELKEAVVNKKKDFNKEMEDCFQLIENIDNLAADYSKSFESLNKESDNK